MISFFVCLAILIIGFMLYSKVAEKVFGPDDRKPPALSMTDGSDYVPMGTPRIFLIQLLNIAGLGPIFGALAGACWGPSVFLWITFGTLLGRQRIRAHRYISGQCHETGHACILRSPSGTGRRKLLHRTGQPACHADP